VALFLVFGTDNKGDIAQFSMADTMEWLLSKGFLAGLGCGVCLTWIILRRGKPVDLSKKELGPQSEEEACFLF
jgi:hypothetical protein